MRNHSATGSHGSSVRVQHVDKRMGCAAATAAAEAAPATLIGAADSTADPTAQKTMVHAAADAAVAAKVSRKPSRSMSSRATPSMHVREGACSGEDGGCVECEGEKEVGVGPLTNTEGTAKIGRGEGGCGCNPRSAEVNAGAAAALMAACSSCCCVVSERLRVDCSMGGLVVRSGSASTSGALEAGSQAMGVSAERVSSDMDGIGIGGAEEGAVGADPKLKWCG